MSPDCLCAKCLEDMRVQFDLKQQRQYVVLAKISPVGSQLGARFTGCFSPFQSCFLLSFFFFLSFFLSLFSF